MKENKQVVITFNKEFLEKGNESVLADLMHNDFVNHTIPPGFPNDINGMIQVGALLRRGFSELQIEIHDMIAEGDLVATRKTIHGKHTGEIMGKAPTGKVISINVMDFVRIKDGRYLEHWGRNDMMQVIQQL